MFVPLEEATAETCGAKAAALGGLLRAGLAVPDGFVVPFAVHDEAVGDPDKHGDDREDPPAHQHAQVTRRLPSALGRGLADLGNPPVAVRSSAADEDGSDASSAGQYDSFLAVHGAADVADAVRACWASLHARRATAYRAQRGDAQAKDVAMAVIVQRLVDAEVSGVLFTPDGRADPTLIEATWGLGPSVVAGTITPDAYRIHENGRITRVIADKPTRIDRVGSQLLTVDVPARRRHRPTLDDVAATRLARLGRVVEATLGAPQDIEWALADGNLWLLQARPITTPPPRPPPGPPAIAAPAALIGTPGSHGTATGTARIVRGPQDFGRVRPGDILICPYTDPAWTPLLGIAAGVVTKTGGILSHAAIVAREHQIPAVLGVPDATTVISDGNTITIDGTAGTVIGTPDRPPPTR